LFLSSRRRTMAGLREGERAEKQECSGKTAIDPER
jgi:hypothetical protein